MKIFILMLFVNTYSTEFGFSVEFESLSACNKAGLAYQELAEKTHSFAKPERVGFVCVEK